MHAFATQAEQAITVRHPEWGWRVAALIQPSTISRKYWAVGKDGYHQVAAISLNVEAATLGCGHRLMSDI